jgi:predicted NACHT family NTPase
MALPALPAGATAWVWEKFGKDFVQGVAGAAWESIRWPGAALRYRQHLYEQYNHIQIFGQPDPVPLEGLFTHVIALDEPAAFHRYDVAALREDAARDPAQVHALIRRKVQRETERFDGMDLVRGEEGHRLFILGKPGAGKTTFLKYVAIRAAQGDPNKVPIFVRLREWQAEGELLPFLARQFDICAFPNATPFLEFLLGRTELALVLFDGLDEIPQEGDRRAEAIAALRDFANKYPDAQVIITCRNAASDYTFQGFHYVELADFNEGQIYAFVRKWFAQRSSMGESFWEDFNRDENRGLRELARQPLLLALLCLAYRKTFHFPQRRVEIYEEALEALLKEWDSDREIRRDEVYHHLPLGRKRQMFARLAAQYFEDGVYFFPQRALADKIAAYLAGLPAADQTVAVADIDGVAVLKAIEAQHGILTECAWRVYTFAHLTFQEYYTARYVVDNALMGTLPKLLAHAHEDRWREVILLAASMFPNADAFFEVFLARLAALVKGDEKLVAFLGWADRKAASVDVPYKPAAVRAYYIWFASASANTITSASASASALASALGSDLDSARARANTLNLALDLNLVSAHALTSTLARDLDRARACDIGDTALHTALSALAVPDADASDKTRDAFAAQLQGIMIEHRDIGHDWEFTETQERMLADYFEAAELLVECLDVAYVTDREAIEARLVVAPGEG